MILLCVNLGPPYREIIAAAVATISVEIRNDRDGKRGAGGPGQVGIASSRSDTLRNIHSGSSASEVIIEAENGRYPNNHGSQTLPEMRCGWTLAQCCQCQIQCQIWGLEGIYGGAAPLFFSNLLILGGLVPGSSPSLATKINKLEVHCGIISCVAQR